MVSEMIPAREYGIGDIEILKGVEAVRRRPGMYIGDPIKPSSLHNLVLGLVEDAFFERSINCAVVSISLHADGAVTVCDDATLDLAAWGPRTAAEAIETMAATLCVPGPHSRAIVNALSERFDLTVWHGGKVYTMAFAEGEPIESLRVRRAGSDRNGTRINFTPSLQIFANRDFNHKVLYHGLRELMAINPGVRFILEDLRSNPPKRLELLHEEQKD